MELKEIYELMDKFSCSGLSGIEITKKDFSISLTKPAAGQFAPPVYLPAEMPAVPSAAPAAPAAAAGPAEQEEFIRSPIVGTFYSSPAPDAPAFVTPGDRVKKGQVVCLIEAMKMMSEITAPRDCTVTEVMLANDSLAQYDAPLFKIQ